MSATIIPAIGLKRNVANNVGTSLKSRVRYGGINGNGNLMKVNTNATALNILIVIKRLFCCIYNFLLPFILLRKGGNLYNKKPPSSPIQTILSASDFHWIKTKQKLIRCRRRLKLLPVGNYTLPRRWIYQFYFKFILHD